MNARRQRFIAQNGLIHVRAPANLRGINGGFIYLPQGDFCNHHGHLYQHPTQFWLVCLNCVSLWESEAGEWVPDSLTLRRQAKWHAEKAEIKRHGELLRAIRDCW